MPLISVSVRGALNDVLLKDEVCCRSPAVVVAYLMKQRRWRLTEAYKWVKEHRPETELTSGMQSL